MSKQANCGKVKDSLNLFEYKENVTRCHGRIESPLPYDTKFPIFLPIDHCFTRLVVRQSHNQVMHNGIRETLTQIRAKYWITKGRLVVKRILSKLRPVSPIYTFPHVQGIRYTLGFKFISVLSLSNLKVRQKEHKDCCLKCQPDKSALAKHAWENDHPIK